MDGLQLATGCSKAECRRAVSTTAWVMRSTVCISVGVYDVGTCNFSKKGAGESGWAKERAGTLIHSEMVDTQSVQEIGDLERWVQETKHVSFFTR